MDSETLANLLDPLWEKHVRITIEVNPPQDSDDIVREVVSTNTYTVPPDIEGTEDKKFGFK